MSLHIDIIVVFGYYNGIFIDQIIFFWIILISLYITTIYRYHCRDSFDMALGGVRSDIREREIKKNKKMLGVTRHSTDPRKRENKESHLKKRRTASRVPRETPVE